MSRPLSDAPTTVMPELHQTQPIKLAYHCGWCDIRLAAVPDQPREFDGRWYHPGGCVSAARNAATGVRIA
jgi:hypothetical protein